MPSDPDDPAGEAAEQDARARNHLGDTDQTVNTISGGIYLAPVIQARDVHITWPLAAGPEQGARVPADQIVNVPDGRAGGHVFISYVRDDVSAVDLLQEKFEEASVPVWRDTSDLWPGEEWRSKIR